MRGLSSTSGIVWEPRYKAGEDDLDSLLIYETKGGVVDLFMPKPGAAGVGASTAVHEGILFRYHDNSLVFHKIEVISRLNRQRYRNLGACTLHQ